MRKLFCGWAIALSLVLLCFLIPATHERAQTLPPSFSAAFDSLGPMTLSSKFAGLPKCSKSAGCVAYLLVCNTTNTGLPDATQCIKINGSASFRTNLSLEVEQDTTTSVSTSSGTYIVGTIPVKPSGSSLNVTP